MDRPNVVLVTTHDTGRHVSPYGVTAVHTPNCKELCAESVLFENSFCTAPQCSPSRASIVTGRYPHANGVMGLTHAEFGWALNQNERTIAMLLGDAGYDTCLFGLQHETNDPSTLGFRHVDLGFSLLDIAEHVRSVLNAVREKPVYLQIGCFETHRPFDYGDTAPDDEHGTFVPGYLADTPETVADLNAFQGAVRRFDEGLGRVLDLLRELNLVENTLLIVTTDHGIAFPRAKGTLYDPGIETMLFCRWPGVISGGARLTEMISNVDILPTILEATRIPVPAAVQGRSFLSLLSGGSYEPRAEIFAEKTYHETYDPMRCIRTRTHKYIRYFEPGTVHDVPRDIMEGGAYRSLGEVPRHESEELFDLTSDPGERVNQAQNLKHEQLLSDLRSRLDEWMHASGDPLLHQTSD